MKRGWRVYSKEEVDRGRICGVFEKWTGRRAPRLVMSSQDIENQ